MDAITLVKPHAKFAARPPYAHMIPKFIKDAYRTAMFGRPGPAFIDLPADLIMGHYDVPRNQLTPIKAAKGPLVVVGKGAAYSRAEKQIRKLVEQTGIPFVPTPMGKGIVADSSPHNFSAARSTALKEADVVLLLGARLNWILTFGLPPKWKPGVKIIQVDLAADELGKNGGDPALGLVGDVGLVVDQITSQLGNWRWEGQSTPFYKTIQAAKDRNSEKAAKKAAVDKVPMTYEHAFDIIKTTLNGLSNPEDGDIVYCSEGANAMDISRTIFTMDHPRIRLDAGTFATMGVGLAYAIASYAAYNFSQPEGSAGGKGRKKIVAIEGDSAFGFSGMEVETMGRYKMDVLIFVINNSGLYRGDTEDSKKWQERQNVTISGGTKDALTATSLGYETEYHKIAEYAGGIGMVVRTPDELRKATEEGFKAKVPVVVNVIVDQQSDLVMVSIAACQTSSCEMLMNSRTSRGSIWLLQISKRRRSCK